MHCQLVIPFEPIVKKNNRPIYRNKHTGKPFTGKSKRLQEAEIETQLSLLQQKNYLRKVQFPITGEITAEISFYRSSKRVCDVSNLVELPNDCMQKVGIFENDSQITHLFLHKYYDKSFPRTEINLHYNAGT